MLRAQEDTEGAGPRTQQPFIHIYAFAINSLTKGFLIHALLFT
jgi:hypothetical protein